MSDLEQLQATAAREIADSDSVRALDDVRVRFLGKKGELTRQLKQLGTLPADQRPAAGSNLDSERRGDSKSHRRVITLCVVEAALSRRNLEASEEHVSGFRKDIVTNVFGEKIINLNEHVVDGELLFRTPVATL